MKVCGGGERRERMFNATAVFDDSTLVAPPPLWELHSPWGTVVANLG